MSTPSNPAEIWAVLYTEGGWKVEFCPDPDGLGAYEFRNRNEEGKIVDRIFLREEDALALAAQIPLVISANKLEKQ